MKLVWAQKIRQWFSLFFQSLQKTIVWLKLLFLNLDSVALQLMDSQAGLGLSLSEACRSIANYKRFLFLHYLHSDLKLVPTQSIDEVLHCHLAFADRYDRDCVWLFGHIVIHDTNYDPASEIDQKKLADSYALTQNLFLQAFGIEMV
jgi:hypothetical protein